MRKVLLAAIVLLALFGLHSSETEANMANGKYPFEAGRWIHLSLPLGDIMIEDVKFHRPRKWKGMLIRHDKPNRATVVVRNTGSERIDVGVAIAVFSEEDGLVGAGNSGATVGLLQPGERHEFSIPFHSVYRAIDEGSHFLITAEH